MKSIQIKRIIIIVLLLFWMSVIFVMSAQPAEQSSELSGGIVSKLIAAFFDKFGSLSVSEQENMTQILTVIVRKSAHFMEYFILGVLVGLFAFTYTKHAYRLKFAFSVVFCVLYSISDEVHQYFVPGRACRILDIIIDTAGSTTAIILLVIIFLYKKRHKSGEINAKKEVD